MINYIEESYYPTVEELLKLPIFSTSYVAAGKGGLDRIVSGINLSDNPDYAQWISPGELMISTCLQRSGCPGCVYPKPGTQSDGCILYQTFPVFKQCGSCFYDRTGR